MTKYFFKRPLGIQPAIQTLHAIKLATLTKGD